jgi:hypothetical protein
VSSLSQVPQFEAQSANFSDRKGPQTSSLQWEELANTGVGFRLDPCFLDCGGLTPLWISPSTRLTPSKAPSIRSTPRHPHFNQTSWVTANLGDPQPFAPSRLRVRLLIL